jgi:tripartite-type tricarboxylate transporter receptor subunit TctC
MATGSTHSVAPYLTKVPYDPVRDFAPIVWIGNATNLLLASPTLNVTTVREFIELAKKNPGKFNYSTSGIGSVAHLTSEHFARMAGIQLTHVPYKGTQHSIPDLVSGQVAILFDNIVTGKPHVDAKRLKALGISSAKRSSLVPDVPTVAESGLPGFESWNWFGILAPAGTRQMVVDRLNESLNKVLQDPAILERFATLGFEPVGGTSAQFAAVIRSEGEKWSRVIREANVKAE